MGTELLILMGFMLSFWALWPARDRQDQPGANRDLGAWLMPLLRDQDPDWRRSFNHENINKPSGPPAVEPERHGTNPPPREP